MADINVRFPPIAAGSSVWETMRMGQSGEADHWFALAHELAVTGRYRNLAEVEAALEAKEPDAILSSNRAARNLISEACYRARWAKGGDT